MRLTRFSSKSQLKNLRIRLTEDQLQSVLFDDEINYKPRGEEKGLLQIVLDAKKITPINLSYLLVSLNASYNNLLYILDTRDSHHEIESNIRPYYSATNASDDVYISQITKGSIIIEFITYIGGGAVVLKLIGDLIPKISAEIRGFRSLPSEKKRQLEEKSLELDIQMKEIDLQEKQLALESKKNELDSSGDISMEVIHVEHIKNSLDLNKIVEQLEFNSGLGKEYTVPLVKEGATPLLNVLYKYEGMGYKLNSSHKGRAPDE